MSKATGEVMRTADGVPLKVSLRRASVRGRIRALSLAAPLLGFILVAFLLPIGDMLFRSVDNRIVPSILPGTVLAIQDWDPQSAEIPGEDIFKALALDMRTAFEEKTLGRVGRRLNYEKPGMSSLFRKTGRRAARIADPPYRDQILRIDRRWGEVNTWRLIHRESGALTGGYFLASVDMKLDDRGEIVRQSEARRIYLTLFWRTLWMSALITVLCLALAYPVAYLLATLPLRLQQPPDDSRPVAVLDVPSGADDVVDRAVADRGRAQRSAGAGGARFRGRAAPDDPQQDRHLRGDGSHPAAVHDSAALFGDEDDFPPL